MNCSTSRYKLLRTRRVDMSYASTYTAFMTLHVTATELRKDVYRLLDQVIDSGETIEVNRKGKLIRIEPADKVNTLASLKPHPDCIRGDPEDLVHMDWSTNWQPDL